MVEPRSVVLASRLADRERRQAAAAELAREVGAESLLVLVHDADVDALLPAPGFAPTMPGGPSWHAFLAECRPGKVHRGEVAYPRLGQLTCAVAITTPDRTVFMLLGGAPELPRFDGSHLAVLSALFRTENALLAARAQARTAQETAQHASTLMAALDVARADAESARAKSDEATRAKDEFLAMLGHELRNPLSPIVTALQLLRMRGDGPLPVEWGIIERQVKHMVRLVDDLLDVARITRGTIELQIRRVQLAAIVSSAKEIAAPHFLRRRQAFSAEIPGLPVWLAVDDVRITQALANLLLNASRYTPPGGHIRLEVIREGAEIVFRLWDDGVGIEAAMLSRIFDLFVQGSRGPDRADGGLGIGLTLVRRLAQMHGGTVVAHSEGLGRGSEFVLRLPAAADEDAADPSVPIGLGSAERGPGEAALKILAVDDNSDALELLCVMLRMSGYCVESARDGSEAMILARSFRPDIAILDIGLPDIDGYSLAGALLAEPGNPTLRLIALTGYGQEHDRRRSFEAGFHAHLVKPVSIEPLIATIRQLFPDPAVAP